MKKIYLIALVVLGISADSFAQVGATAAASATIITPIAISKASDMNFGNLAVSTTAGTVVLSPAGTRTKTDGVTLPATAGTVTAASFNISGATAATYSITLPTSIVLNSGSNTMTVTDFTSTSGAATNSNRLTGTLTGGSESIFVGATLNVSASQVAGVYSTLTPFTVTVNYN